MEWVDVSERGWLQICRCLVLAVDWQGCTGAYMDGPHFSFFFPSLHFRLSMGYIRMGAKLCHVNACGHSS